MESDKLIEIISIQSEIIEILSQEYLGKHRSPVERDKMRELLDLLNSLYE